MNNKVTLLLTFSLLTIFCFSQSLKYKKDVEPFINEGKYSPLGFSNAKAYHAQNVNSDNSLTDKALLLQFDNMYVTRIYLALCYHDLAQQDLDPVKMDSAVMYLNLALSLYDDSSIKEMVKTFNNDKTKIFNQVQNNKIEQEKIAHELKYGLKTDTVKFISTELNSSCTVTATKRDNSTITFYNPNLSKYGDNCELKFGIQNEDFVITHRLEMVFIYREGDGKDEIEAQVLKSINLLDTKKGSEFDNKVLEEYKLEMSSLIQQGRDAQVSSQLLDLYQDYIDTLTTYCSESLSRMEGLKSHIDIKSQQNEKSKEIELQSAEFTQIQKDIKSKVSCLSCIEKTLSDFLKAMQDSDVPTVKKYIAKCCMMQNDNDGKTAGCSELYVNTGKVSPFDYYKYSSNPGSGVTRANRWIKEQDRWFIYFESPQIARVIIAPQANEEINSYSKRTFFVLIYESGVWKVYGSDDNEKRIYILEASKTN